MWPARRLDLADGVGVSLDAAGNITRLVLSGRAEPHGPHRPLDQYGEHPRAWSGRPAYAGFSSSLRRGMALGQGVAGAMHPALDADVL